MIQISLPAWANDVLAAHPDPMPEVHQRMRLAIELSRLNVEHGMGGPFGAAVFDVAAGGKLVSIGMNLVTTGLCSVLHAEIVAIIQAQQALRNYNLAAVGQGAFELVSTTEPCAMCLGAIPWSGIRRLVCGARGADAEQIGFHEGRKPEDGVLSLRQDGIHVETDVLRDETVAVLRLYHDKGGSIYNGTQATG